MIAGMAARIYGELLDWDSSAWATIVLVRSVRRRRAGDSAAGMRLPRTCVLSSLDLEMWVAHDGDSTGNLTKRIIEEVDYPAGKPFCTSENRMHELASYRVS